MKPLRRLMREIEQVTDFENINWSIQADPKTLPNPGPVTNEDFDSAVNNTKSACHHTNLVKYEKWMEEFGSV